VSRVLAIGDVHTKTWIIDQVAELVDDYDHIVFCGDYADNFNTVASATLDTWRKLKLFTDSNPKVHAVLGNHDYSYLHKEIAGRSSGWNPVTFQLINAPENKDLRDWLLSLPIIFQLEGVSYSHAGITEDWNGEYDSFSLWSDVSPIWARPKEFGGNVTYKPILQVIGHNTSESIWQPAPTVWCIDTFSEHRDNTPAGDFTVLEIINATQFNKRKLKENKNENNNNTASFETEISR